MPLEVKTPLYGTLVLSDKTLRRMLDIIAQTYKTSIEFGLAFCKEDNTIEPGEICEGDGCSVEVPGCLESTERVGDCHTHPNTIWARGYGYHSITDSMSDLLARAKLSCIWGQQDNIVSCRSLTRQPSNKELTTLRQQFIEALPILEKIRTKVPIVPSELEKVRILDAKVSDYSKEVLKTDRAGLEEAKTRVKSFEDCLTYYSHRELVERTKKAGISSEGGKKELCRKLLALGVL